MAGPKLDLMPGEKMVLHSHPHWWYFWKEVVGAIVLVVLVGLWIAWEGTISTIVGWLIVLGLVILICDLIYQFAQWQTTRFAVTDQRVAYQSGFLHRRGVSIPLNRVNNVNFNQNLMARILNNGVVVIESAGQTGDSVFENIPDPEHVRNVIFAQVEADEVADSKRAAADLREAMQGVPTESPAGGPSSTERLQQLTDLRDRGLVTPDEFETKRREILGDL